MPGACLVREQADGVPNYAAVPRPSGSSLMPLRRPHHASELRTGLVWSYGVDRPPHSQEQVGGVLSAAASRRRQLP